MSEKQCHCSSAKRLFSKRNFQTKTLVGLFKLKSTINLDRPHMQTHRRVHFRLVSITVDRFVCVHANISPESSTPIAQLYFVNRLNSHWNYFKYYLKWKQTSLFAQTLFLPRAFTVLLTSSCVWIHFVGQKWFGTIKPVTICLEMLMKCHKIF